MHFSVQARNTGSLINAKHYRAYYTITIYAQYAYGSRSPETTNFIRRHSGKRGRGFVDDEEVRGGTQVSMAEAMPFLFVEENAHLNFLT